MILPDDTIAQIATAPGGGVGVIRVSGPDAFVIAERCFRGLPSSWEPRRLYHGWWTDGEENDLDEGLLVLMPGPHSYTGEDVAEIHVHGGPLNLNRCLDVCWRWGARPAEAGEFTRRAFLNGRMDLTRAEAIADLVAAQTDRALHQAR
ncbi:MAG: tRNA uridine-5-carboxymethylaminomethyl(34) synthesis GTPase MnmE, partial [Myxococcota bacterium]|nr:tRNA uridine-5-carboxymethylaminomethyl(34) synthesis GTPase MnmE [Myxococcota bacterium]